jgi:flavin reductase (DIM6/NTAB) family NADH-FMN oxidoreductase RutF
MIINPGETKTAQFHQLLLSAIAPRPICFASTIDKEGRPNLSPFSFFNVFGSKPPILIFSPARRVRDNTIKHTLENAIETGEVVINVVNYAIVQQMSLSSCEYGPGVNEFVKAGLSPLASDLVKPFRVKESPVHFECKVLEVKATGEEGGAGNLIICEVLRMHINDDVLNEQQQIDPNKIDLVARMGGDYYCRASGDAIFTVPKPNLQLGMGIDQLPEDIKNSSILRGNHLGQLANYTQLPEKDPAFIPEEGNPEMLAAAALDANDADKAWQILLHR